MVRELLIKLLTLLLAGSSLTPALAPGNPTPEACKNLAAVALPNTEIKTAKVVPAGSFEVPEAQKRFQPQGLNFTDVPAFCWVAGFVEKEIYFEVWLPTKDWNGRLVVGGNGGWAGSIQRYQELAKWVKDGYAAAATDTGHVGTNREGQWALGRPDRIANLGYRSIHETAVKAKALVNAFYGQLPNYSYFWGCSTGGRQGLMAAQRYPGDFDGIVAGAPAINWTTFLSAELWPALVTQDKESFIPAEKLQAITKAVLEAWDDRDGVKDGVIEDPSIVKVDLASVQKAAGLTDKQVAALKKIYEGPRNAAGERVWYGLAPGSEYAWSGGLAGPEPFSIPIHFYKYLVKDDPNWEWRTLNYDSDLAQAKAEMAHIFDADNPDLSDFKQRGGKLIIWHGWNDQLIFPEGTIRYYKNVVETMGGTRKTEEFARLFMAPGVEHCRGGSGPNQFDALKAVVNWVENGIAPDRLVAARVENGQVVRTRPLCPYPQVARWTGNGSTNHADNFVCQLP